MAALIMYHILHLQEICDDPSILSQEIEYSHEQNIDLLRIIYSRQSADVITFIKTF